MTTRSLKHLLTLGALTTMAIVALSAPATLLGKDKDKDKDDDDDLPAIVQLATGQFVTPTILSDVVQQYLNPGLPAYPNFVAGEAVRSQLSPDGSILAILTAGQNSLYKPDGTVDVPNSTQFLFLYNVAGGNKTHPQLIQVLKQVNAHVGLVFSPDGNTLYAAGGNDDAVYVYTRAGAMFAPAAPIPLNHFAPGAKCPSAIGAAAAKPVAPLV